MIRLKQLRLDGGYTVSALAEKAGVARHTIARIEEDSGRPVHPTSLKRIADVFGVQPSELLAAAVFTPSEGEAA